MSRAASGAALLSDLVRTPQAIWPVTSFDSAQNGSLMLVAVAEALVGGDLSRLPLPPTQLRGHAEAEAYAPAAWMRADEWPRWCAEVRERVTEKRLAHAYRVALLAAQLAYAAGLDTRRAFAAGVLHDIARDLPEAQLLRLAPPQCRNEAAHPLALHGRAARTLLENLGFGDVAVLRAVEEHVTGPQVWGGEVGLGRTEVAALSVCVYIADVSEPARGVNDHIRAVAFDDLSGALRAAIASKVDYLHGRGLEIHPATLSLHRRLECSGEVAVMPEARAGANSAGLQRTRIKGIGVTGMGAGANW